MIYEAIVIDNSKFFERGTITVRVSNFYFGNMTYNLVDDFPNSIKDNEIEGIDYKTLDFEALIHSSIGGGRNYGLFAMPQINEHGIVSFLNGGNKKIVWLGSIFNPIKEEGEIKAVNIPSDKLEAEGVNQDGSINKVNNLENESINNNIILRTKNTIFTDTSDDINWEKVSTTNIVSIGEDRVKLIHFAKEDGWNETTPEKYQSLIMEKNEDNINTITLSNINITDELESKISILEDKIELYTNGENGENTFSVGSGENGGFILTDVYGNKIVLSEDGILIQAEGKLDIIGTDDISVNTDGNVNITGGKVILQGEDGGAVRIKELNSIMGKWEGHGHICPSGPTVGPPTDGTPAPLPPMLISDKQNLESKDVVLK